MNPVSYEYQAERRSMEAKTILKWWLVIGGATAAGLLVAALYVAFAKQPQFFRAFAVVMWFVSISVSMMVAWAQMKRANRLQARLDEIYLGQAQAPRPVYVAPAGGVAIEQPAQERTIETIVRDLERNLDDLTYYDLANAMKMYPQSNLLKGKVLNWMTFWTRHPERPKAHTRRQILAEMSEAG